MKYNIERILEDYEINDPDGLSLVRRVKGEACMDAPDTERSSREEPVKNRFVLYLVCFNTYIKKGGGTTGHVNEASLYNDRQITSLNLPNTVALYIDKGKAADIESPGLVRPWQMQTAVGNNIPDILPSRALSIDNKEKARVKEINELAHTINSMNIDNPKRTTLIKEYINLAYNN